MERESAFSPEIKKPTETKIILEFMRHGKKESDKSKKNQDLMLAESGKQQAREKGKKLKPQLAVAVGRGSMRKRTEETVMHAMLAEQDIEPNSSLEDMNKLVAKELKFGKKSVPDSRLDFSEDGPIGKELDAAYEAGKYLEFLVNSSDRRALETNDKISSTYSRMSGNVAELINGYMIAGNNFNRLAENGQYEKYGNQLERYLGTHQGIAEMFLAKALEKNQGIEARDKFITSVGGGFKETEGIHVEILNHGEEQKISIQYEAPDQEGKKIAHTLELEPEMIQEIITERDEFEKIFENK